jgi:hypothetical protein
MESISILPHFLNVIVIFNYSYHSSNEYYLKIKPITKLDKWLILKGRNYNIIHIVRPFFRGLCNWIDLEWLSDKVIRI